MDLHLQHTVPTDEERDAIDALLGPPESTWDGGRAPRGNGQHDSAGRADTHTAVGGRRQRETRHLLLPALRALQSRVGWISESGLEYVCLRLNVPPADAWGVATFYALLSTTPRARRVLHVCDDIACRCKGARELIERLESPVGPAHAHAPAGDHVEIGNSDAVWMRSPCLGMCDHAPAAFLQVAGAEPHEEALGEMTIERALSVMSGATSPSVIPSPPSVIPSEARNLPSAARGKSQSKESRSLAGARDDKRNEARDDKGKEARDEKKLLKRVGTVDPTRDRKSTRLNSSHVS